MSGGRVWRGRTPAQWFCLIGGAALLVRGAVGVALDPVFESPGEGWHQLIHMSTGIVLLLAGRGVDQARVLALGFGAVYAAIGVVGVLNGSDVANVIPVAASDNTLHSVIALSSLGAGLLSLRRGPVAEPAGAR